jgi:hypothetical protein
MMNNFYCRRCTYANENFVIKTMSFRQKFLNSLRFKFNVSVKCAKLFAELKKLCQLSKKKVMQTWRCTLLFGR